MYKMISTFRKEEIKQLLLKVCGPILEIWLRCYPSVKLLEVKGRAKNDLILFLFVCLNDNFFDYKSST